MPLVLLFYGDVTANRPLPLSLLPASLIAPWLNQSCHPAFHIPDLKIIIQRKSKREK